MDSYSLWGTPSPPKPDPWPPTKALQIYPLKRYIPHCPECETLNYYRSEVVRAYGRLTLEHVAVEDSGVIENGHRDYV